MTDKGLQEQKLKADNIRQVQEAVYKTDTITSSHLKNINEELELLYRDIVERIPERNIKELQLILQNVTTELHEKIKNCYW